MSTPGSTPGGRRGAAATPARTPVTPQSIAGTPASAAAPAGGRPLGALLTPRSIRGSGSGSGRGSSGASVPATPQTPRLSQARRELGNRSGLPATPIRNSSDGTQVIESTNLWGTTVSVEQTKKAFQRFFENFPSFDPAVPLYPALLMETLDRGETNINLNAKNISDFDANLYKLLVTYPSDVLPIADFVLGELRHKLQNPQNDPEVTAEINEAEAITSRPFNLIEKKNMRDLNPEDMDTLICVKGMVIRVGAIVPEMQRAAFSCALCAFETEVGIEDGLINEPVQCGNCQARHSYRLVHNRSKYFDKQLIKVQETPDSIPEGETPHSIKLCAFAQLVDFVKPGDRVEITGIYKALGSRVNPKRSALHTIYRTFVDTIHFRKMDVDRLQNESNIGAEVMSDVVPGAAEAFDESDATAQQTAEKEARILALSQEPEIYEKLTRSLAPSIWELEDVKKGILCLLFGGSGAEQGASSGKFRGEINVLMCGDPGTSKSQLLQYVHKIAPRGIYTSGKGSSAVGLTASVVRDAETKEMVLESGALVLSDLGVCCIDEFDKMSDATRSILHEVMEQQTVSIAKAGIVCTLNARTSILASANPKESRYNPKLSVVENVQIMPTLLSRFDLIYLVLDQPNEMKDRKLAKHLVGLYHEDVDRAPVEDAIESSLFKEYISYARRNVRPMLTAEAEDKLIEFYTGMRQQGVNQKTITATPRQLEALIRLSEALAKMKLSKDVTVEHVYEAKRLMDVATQRAATDPTTGRIDMDLLQTGHSHHDLEESKRIGEGLLEMIKGAGPRGIRDRSLLEQLNTSLRQSTGRQLNYDRFKEVLRDLEVEGEIRQTKDNLVRIA